MYRLIAIIVVLALTVGFGMALTGCGGGTTTNITVVSPGELPSRTYRVPSVSMEPTLTIGQRVTLKPVAADHLRVGGIVIFHPPKDAQQEVCGPVPHTIRTGGAACAQPEGEPASVKFIKRIVAGPDDEIYIREGHVFRKPAGKSSFKAESDHYIKPCELMDPRCNFPTPIRIPAGHWFMMGDNRGESDDSRFWGPVPTRWVVGGAFATYWPPDRIGLL